MPCVYDDIPGSWGDQSKGWPQIKDPDEAARKLVISRGLVPYGSYVTVGDYLRLETQEYVDRVRAALAATAQPEDYPECSGEPNSCPENEGYGCCKKDSAQRDHAPASPSLEVEALADALIELGVRKENFDNYPDETDEECEAFHREIAESRAELIRKLATALSDGENE